MASVVQISVGLIIFATLGVAAITLLVTASTGAWGSTIQTLGVTVVVILAALAVALSFMPKGHGL